MRRIVGWKLVSLIFAMLVLQWGCTKDKANNNNTLIVALGSEPSTLDPRFATDANGMRIGALLFNSLVRVSPDLKVVGDLAESWDYDDLVYTFRLHPNLTFSNGRAVTAEDILFSFAQYRSPKSPFHSGQKTIEKVEAFKEGEQLVVKIFLKAFSAKFLNSDLPAVKILPKAETLAAGQDFGNNLIGTGSFQLINQSANELTLKARKDHPFAPPKVDQLVFKIIRDDFTRFQKTLKGSIDIAQAEISPDKVSEFEKRSNQFQVFKYPGLSTSYLLINLNDPILKQKQVRRALAHAIDRNEIIKYKMAGLARAATSLLTPQNPFHNEALKSPAFDLKQARDLLQQSQSPAAELTLKTSNSQSAVDKGRVLAHQLGQAGFKIKMQSYEWGTFYGDISKGRFQLATMRWVGVFDPDIYRIAFHSQEKPPGRNRGQYKNLELDKLLEKGLKIENEAERIAHYNKVQQIIQEDLAIIPLWYDEQVSIVHKRVKGYNPPQTGDFTPFIHVEKDSK